MKKHILNRHERLFTKLFERQGVKIKELGVPEMTAWQAIEEEEDLSEGVPGLITDPDKEEMEDSSEDDTEEEEEISEGKNNPYAICTDSVGRDNEEKYKSCKDQVAAKNKK